MTVLNSESTILSGGTRTLPRVNLMPPEVAEARALRRLQMALGAVGVGAVAVVGLLYVSASHSLSSAKNDLATAQSQTTALNTKIAQYNDVVATIQQAQAAQAQLTTAMGDEVRFSQRLYDLSLTVPSNVWLKSLAFTTAAPATSTPAATTLPAAGAQAATPAATPIGSMTVAAVGFSHDDVAVWLEAIAGLKTTYSNPYFASSSEALLGPRKVVNFSASASLMSTAESHRYTNSTGS